MSYFFFKPHFLILLMGSFFFFSQKSYGALDERLATLEFQLAELRGKVDIMDDPRDSSSSFDPSQPPASAHLSKLVSRLQSMETMIQDLRGKVEESQHRTQMVEKQLEFFKADVEVRFRQQASAPSLRGEGSLDSIGKLIAREEGSTPASRKEGSTGKGKKEDKETFEELQATFKKDNFKEAAQLAQKFLKDFPQSAYTGAVTLFHGRALALQGNHQKATVILMKGYKQAPKGKKAPDLLFHAAQSLGALTKKAEACATLDKITEDYPTISESLKKSIQKSMKKFSCEA